MRLWFGGAEVAAHRKSFAKSGVMRVGLNMSAYFKQRQPKIIDDEAYADYEIVLHSSDRSNDPLKTEEFVGKNIQRFSFVYGIEAAKEIADIKYVPEWDGTDNIAVFYRLCEAYPQVGVSESVALDPIMMNQIRMHVQREDVGLWINSSKVDIVGQRVWTDVICSGWLNVQRQRELQFWDGSHVSRVNRDKREAAIEKHATQITRLGGDVELLKAEDTPAGQALALTSWRMYETNHSDSGYPLVATISAAGGVPGIAEVIGDILATPVVQTRHRVPVALPLIAPSFAPGSEQEGAPVQDTRIALSGVQMRTCDPCKYNQRCPLYEPHASCGYSIPVTIKTKDEKMAAESALLEMQLQRIFMERFGEDIDSQGLGDRVGQEIDRWMRMVKTLHDTSQVRETLTITATQQAKGGALSAIFGSKVGELNRQLSAPVTSDEMMDSIIEAEVVDT